MTPLHTFEFLYVNYVGSLWLFDKRLPLKELILFDFFLLKLDLCLFIMNSGMYMKYLKSMIYAVNDVI